MSGKKSDRVVGETQEDARVIIEAPSTSDGAEIWRIARDSRKLDLNSSYAYLLWCRDFADTSAVARQDDRIVGFVIGYVRPSAPDTFVVWQVAVDITCRGRGVGRALLEHLVERMSERGVTCLEATVTPDNHASSELFGSLAKRHGATLTRSPLFHSAQFPDTHESEELYRIGPFVLDRENARA